MRYEAIRLALTNRMQAFAGIDQSRIEYPNSKRLFVVPEMGLWCRFSINFATAFMAGMADVPHTRKPGIATVQCFARLNEGVKDLVQLADELEAHFAYWAVDQLECMEASVIMAGESPSPAAFGGAGFYQVNVNIRFRAG